MVKQILRYLKGTTYYGILYRREHNVDLEAFVESNWAGDPQFKRSTIVALSIVEAKYHALIEGTKEIVWPRKILNEINYIKLGLIVIFVIM